MDGPFPAAPAGDDGDCTLIAQRRVKAIGVISAVRNAALHASGRTDERVGTLDVRCIARRQREPEWPPEEIDERMDLRRPAAARDANGIGLSPPFPPPAQR